MKNLKCNRNKFFIVLTCVLSIINASEKRYVLIKIYTACYVPQIYFLAHEY